MEVMTNYLAQNPVVTVFGAVTFAAFFVYSTLKSKQSKEQKSSPSPPIVRSEKWFEAPPFVKFGKDPLPFLLDCQKKYGDVFTIDLLLTKMTFVVSHELADSFFSAKNDDLDMYRGIIQFVKVVIGHDFYDNPDWVETNRMFYKKSFTSSTQLKDFVSKIREEVKKGVARWAQMGEIDLFLESSNLTLLTMLRVLLGDLMYEKYSMEFAETARAMELNTFTPMTLMFPWLPFGKPKVARDSRDKLQSWIAPHVRDLAENKISTTDTNYASFVVSNFSLNDGGCTEDLFVKQLMGAIFAGHMNVAALTGWGTLHVAADKRVQAKLREEIDLQDLDTCDFTKLHYAKACMMEAGRLYSNARHLRMAGKGFKIGSYEADPGSMMVFATLAVVNNPKYVDEPSKFKPERPEEEPFVQQNNRLFGGGKHPCLGERIATATVSLALSYLFKNYDIEIVGDFPKPDWEKNLGTPFAFGQARVRVRPRQL